MTRLNSEEKKKTRESILKASREIFLEKGFSRTRTKDIAEKAGIAEGTIFNYFPTKMDIFIETMAEGYITDRNAAMQLDYRKGISELIFDLFYKTLQPLMKLPDKIIRELAVALVHISSKSRGFVKRLAKLDYNLIDDLSAVFDRLKDEKRMKPFDSGVMAEIIFFTVFGEIMLYIFEGKDDRDIMLDNIKKKIAMVIDNYVI